MEELMGCPMKAQIFRKDLLTGEKKLTDIVTELAGNEKEAFFDFAFGMLQWLPKKRKTAYLLLLFYLTHLRAVSA